MGWFLKVSIIEGEIKILKEVIRQLSIYPPLACLIYQIIQTQDIFSIRFQPEYSECDISIHEFKKYADIREQVIRILDDSRFSKKIKQQILDNLDDQALEMENNIKYFGVAHIFD